MRRLLLSLVLLLWAAPCWSATNFVNVVVGPAGGAAPATASFNFMAESTSDPWTNANWTIIPKTDVNDTVRIVVGTGGNAITTSTNDDLILYWDTDTFGAKQYSSVKINQIGSVNDYTGPAVRIQTGAFSCYFASIRDTTRIKVFQVVAGSYTQLGSTIEGLTIADDDVITLKADGNSLTVFQNGTQRGSAFTPSAGFSSGSTGIIWDYIDGKYETWEGGEW